MGGRSYLLASPSAQRSVLAPDEMAYAYSDQGHGGSMTNAQRYAYMARSEDGSKDGHGFGYSDDERDTLKTLPRLPMMRPNRRNGQEIELGGIEEASNSYQGGSGRQVMPAAPVAVYGDRQYRAAEQGHNRERSTAPSVQTGKSRGGLATVHNFTSPFGEYFIYSFSHS